MLEMVQYNWVCSLSGEWVYVKVEMVCLYGDGVYVFDFV